MQINSTPRVSMPLPTTAPETRQLAGEHLSAIEQQTSLIKTPEPTKEEVELRDKFQEFVGQTFFSELIKSLRTSQKGAAYFNGGRAEEIFQGQFDQMMTEHLSESSAKSISDPMFELFQLGRVR